MSSEDVASSPHVSPFYTHTDYLHNDLQGFYSCWGSSSLDSSILHGLSAQQVPRQQRIDWGGTPHDPAFLRIGGSPQAGILLHAAPQQLSACLCSAATAAVAAAAVVVVVPVGRVADWMGGSGAGPAHPSLIGAWSSLPAGGSTEQLALCKEAINILFPGKLCQDGGVPEHAPAHRQGEDTQVRNISGSDLNYSSGLLANLHVQGLLSLGSFILGAVAHHSAALRQVEVERDQGAVLHAQCSQSGTVDLGHTHTHTHTHTNSRAVTGQHNINCERE